MQLVVIFQDIVDSVHAEPGINKITMPAEGIILPAIPDLFSKFLIFWAVPGFLDSHLMEIAEIRHLKIVAAADTQFAVWHDPHVSKRHQTGLLYDLLRCLFVRR